MCRWSVSTHIGHILVLDWRHDWFQVLAFLLPHLFAVLPTDSLSGCPHDPQVLQGWSRFLNKLQHVCSNWYLQQKLRKTTLTRDRLVRVLIQLIASKFSVYPTNSLNQTCFNLKVFKWLWWKSFELVVTCQDLAKLSVCAISLFSSFYTSRCT